ncbi:sodium:proton antiporter [Halorussus gelatinilyticus]|uniref:Sodium:proton antiporter n=1 Tax=Halorussus gelatinilyticus TaxID=2937524 RepID=A0A8U0IJ75_9EURY|nr:Na+/H+ antiporter NhaC family protein [Halorussus gelatinilyticus]UPW00848.1 sodium:proton antiporter [Halorussus gelatinilyticus]
MALESIDAGVWSLVPAILAITLAWTTRDALIGLFVGVASAGPIYGALKPGAAAVGVPPDMVGQVLVSQIQTPWLTVGPVTTGNLLGALFGLKLIPTLVATAPLFSSAWYVENVLLAIFAIGGMIGLMIRAGAIQGVLEALADWADSPADAEKAAYIAGIAVHIDDYFNCLVVGSMMRPLTDKYNVSRAKLAYYVDSAGSPAARLAFYSTWGAALIGFIGAGLESAASQGVLPQAMSGFVKAGSDGPTAVTAEIWPLFFNSLFFGFYSWVALIIAALVAWQVFPNIFGMKREEERARAGNGVVGEDHDPMISEEMDRYEMAETATTDWRNFAVPVAVMIAVGLGAMFWRGSPVVHVPGEPENLLFALGGYQFMLPPAGEWAFNIGGVKLGLAATAALVVAAVLYRLRGDIPSNDDATDAMVHGFKGIFLAALILMLASSIQNSVTVLGISNFVTDWFRGVPAAVIPLLVFLATAGISFADGSSWSTYGIMFPIAIPVAFTTGANLPLVLGAVFSGGIFGDHSSPISDTTVLASSTSGSDHLVHVRTQIPYAVVTAAIAGTLFLLLGFVLPQGFEIFPY